MPIISGLSFHGLTYGKEGVYTRQFKVDDECTDWEIVEGNFRVMQISVAVRIKQLLMDS